MEMCAKCKTEKPLSEFYKNSSRSSSWCKECQKKDKKEHYKNNKEQYAVNGFKNRKWFYDLKKGLKCERCGFNHPAALDFHHRDPKEKLFEISKALVSKKNITREMIEEEIKKCEVLCANCHRIEHATRYLKQ